MLFKGRRVFGGGDVARFGVTPSAGVNDGGAKKVKVNPVSKSPGESSSTAEMGADDLTFNDITTALQALLGNDPDGDGDYDYPYVVDVKPLTATFIYSCDGQYYEQGFTIDENGVVGLAGVARPTQRRTVYEPMVFGISEFGDPEGDWVPWSGKIFECGYYPHPKQQIDARKPEYLDGLVKSFAGAKLKDTHDETQSLFSDRLGTCESIERVGTELHGRGLVHRAVKDLLGDRALPLSVEIERAEDPPRISAIAMLRYPQITDAALVAAFADFGGARHNKDDRARIQAIHDSAVALGAACTAEMGARHSGSDSDAIQKMHDLAVEQGAKCSPDPATAAMGRDSSTRPGRSDRRGQGGKPMDLWEKIKGYFGSDAEARQKAGLTEADLENLAAGRRVSEHVTSELAAQFQAMRTEHEAMQAQFASQRAQSVKLKASEFAKQIIEVERKALPVQRGRLENLYVMAANADGEGGVAKFGNDGVLVEGDNVKELRAMFASAKPLSVFEQAIPDVAIGGDGENVTRQQRAAQINANAVEAYNGGRW